MVRFEELNAETVQQYRNEIAQFYYGNMLTCSCLVHYTFDQAYEKIGDLIAHLCTNTCIAYGAVEEKRLLATYGHISISSVKNLECMLMNAA